jgi:hypothetical protein
LRRQLHLVTILVFFIWYALSGSGWSLRQDTDVLEPDGPAVSVLCLPALLALAAASAVHPADDPPSRPRADGAMDGRRIGSPRHRCR